MILDKNEAVVKGVNKFGIAESVVDFRNDLAYHNFELVAKVV